MSPQTIPGKERPQVAVLPGCVEVHTTVCVEFNGIPRWLRGGDLPARDADGLPPKRNRVTGMIFADSHPLVQQRPDLFRPVEFRLEELPD